MENNLTLATKRSFGSLECDFYKGSDNKDFYMTREQVGTALEYPEPRKAIQKIHDRNADRLNPFSTVVKLGTVEGNRNVTREVIVYTLRGVMEICRFSRQPKADKFMDFVWDVMESLYNGRNVYASPDQQSAVSPQTMQTFMDAMLKTQLETARCMVAMTNTMSAMADRILNNVVQPVAVATPVETDSENIRSVDFDQTNENHTDDVPAAVAVEPASTPEPKQTKHYSNTDAWRRKVYDKVNHICANEPYRWPTSTSVLSSIYRKMRDKYGFVVDDERSKWNQRHPYSKNPAVITLVQANATWTEIFESILNDMYDHSITECVRRQDEKKKAVEEVKPKVEVKETNKTFYKKSPLADDKWYTVYDCSFAVKPVKATVAENRNKIRDAVVKVSKEYGHSNYTNPYSYKLVYNAMGLEWDDVILHYLEKVDGYEPARYEIVAHSNVLTAIFLAAAEKVINDHKNPKSDKQ